MSSSFFFYRVTQEGQGVIDRKIMSSVTLLKKVSQNILKPHEVWKYETLLHTLAVGSDRLQCILEMIRDQSFVLHFVWWRNTMLWSNTGGCFAFWTGSCTVCIKMTLELFVQTVKKKKKKKWSLQLRLNEFQRKATETQNICLGIKLKPGAFLCWSTASKHLNAQTDIRGL